MNEELRKNGALYSVEDAALFREQMAVLDLLHRSNAIPPSHVREREAVLKGLFAALGEECLVIPPFQAAWGKNIHFGDRIFCNSNLTLLDDADIFVGDDVMFAPNVTVTTAAHPIDPTLRRKKMEYNLSVIIEENVWIGAGAILLPGVTIGKNTVVGAGSVVTKSLPANVVAAGNPCRVLREIDADDRRYYRKGCKVDPSFFGEIE